MALDPRQQSGERRLHQLAVLTKPLYVGPARRSFLFEDAAKADDIVLKSGAPACVHQFTENGVPRAHRWKGQRVCTNVRDGRSGTLIDRRLTTSPVDVGEWTNLVGFQPDSSCGRQ